MIPSPQTHLPQTVCRGVLRSKKKEKKICCFLFGGHEERWFHRREHECVFFCLHILLFARHCCCNMSALQHESLHSGRCKPVFAAWNETSTLIHFTWLMKAHVISLSLWREGEASISLSFSLSLSLSLASTWLISSTLEPQDEKEIMKNAPYVMKPLQGPHTNTQTLKIILSFSHSLKLKLSFPRSLARSIALAIYLPHFLQPACWLLSQFQVSL